jgi:hypothetical protein
MRNSAPHRLAAKFLGILDKMGAEEPITVPFHYYDSAHELPEIARP